MEQAIKVAACLQEMQAVQVKYGLIANPDYDGRPEFTVATEKDIAFLMEPPGDFSFFVGARGGKEWCCRKDYETGRRVIADASFSSFGDGEPFANEPDVQWEWLT